MIDEKMCTKIALAPRFLSIDSFAALTLSTRTTIHVSKFNALQTHFDLQLTFMSRILTGLSL
jgi:hypothetical protein